MTSYNTPAPYVVSPEIPAFGTQFGGYTWNAFEGLSNKGLWIGNYDVNNTYVQFDAGEAILIRGISFNGYLYGNDIYVPVSFKLKGSNDETNWDLLAEIDSDHIVETQTFEFANNSLYRYYRLTNIVRYSTWISTAICNIKFYIFQKKGATS